MAQAGNEQQPPPATAGGTGSPNSYSTASSSGPPDSSGSSKGSAQPSAARAVRPLWMQIYLPNLVVTTGRGAMLPILIYAAKNLHASPATATAVVAVNALGTMVFDLPAGRIISRLGERKAGAVAPGLIVLGLVGCLFAQSVPAFAISVFVQAAGWSLWGLVRITHLSRVAPAFARGRALSIYGGVSRAGSVIGPFLFIAVATDNDVRSAFLIYAICAAVGFTWLAAARDRTDSTAASARTHGVHPRQVVADNRRQFSTAGVGAFGIGLLRGSRNAIVPLWAAHIGLDSSSAATIFAFSSLVDLALFYPSGIISDRWGRKAVALPCALLLSIGHILIPFSHSFATLFLVALILGFGNGAGSGIVQTLGADLAPQVGRASFLSVWRMIADGGTTAGPIVDTAVIAISSISLAGPVIGVLGLGAAVVMARWLPEPQHLAGRLGRHGTRRNEVIPMNQELAINPDGSTTPINVCSDVDRGDEADSS